MDPVSVSSIIFAIVGVINTTQRILELARNIRKVEGTKVDQLYYRLVLEKKRTEGWVNSMRGRGASSLRATVSPGELENVTVLLAKLMEHYDLAAKRFSRFSTAQERTERGFIARMKLASGGYDDIKDLLETLATMNAALYAMAPPFPPGYSPTPTAPEYVARDSVQSSSSAAFDESERDEDISITPSGILPSATPVDTDISPTVLESEDASPSLTLQTLYSSALKSMMVIGNTRDSSRLVQIGHRLQTWGIGLFNSSISMDEILKSNKGDNSLIIECVRKALVKILVLEERELITLSEGMTGMEQGILKSTREDIASLLIAEETFAMATMIWKSLIEDEEEAERKSKDIFFTAEIIESLFDILPTIMMIRQVFFLRLESYKMQSSAEGIDQNNKALAKDASESNIDQNLWTIKIALKTRDEEAKKRGQKIQLYEPMLEKVLHQRAELLNSHTQPRDTKLLDEKEKELSEVISKFVQGIHASTNEDTKPVSLKSNLETKQKPGNIKIPFDEKGTKQIDDFIEYFARNYATPSDLATSFSR